MNKQIIRLIEQNFRAKTCGFKETIWLTTVDIKNILQSQVSNSDVETRKSELIHRVSLKMAKTARNLQLPSGFEDNGGKLIRVVESPRADFDKHETIALGGIPIMVKDSKCIGAIGVAGLEYPENFEVAMSIIPASLFFIDPNWRLAFNASSLIYS